MKGRIEDMMQTELLHQMILLYKRRTDFQTCPYKLILSLLFLNMYMQWPDPKQKLLD